MNTMNDMRTRSAIEAELLGARVSRAEGNEGRARVCARRAAGLAIGTYFERNTGENPPQSAYRLLQWFSQRDEIPEDLLRSAQRLSVRVTPDFELPHQEDPIEDALLIITAIMDGFV
jgi:hypothetical protein